MSKLIYLFSTSSHKDAISINSLDITFLKPNIDFSKYDYLIITSKQTSNALENYEKEDYIGLSALCVSTPSALAYKNLGANVLDIGEGYGNNLISKIKEYPKERRWLYLRAKVVASNFVELCVSDGYNISEAIVYESRCSKDIENIKLEDRATLIFTSPSSVKCFLKNHTISKSHRVIVIGHTTLKALPENIEYQLSKETTIQSCMELAL